MVRDFGRGFAMRNDELIRAVENDDLLSCEVPTQLFLCDMNETHDTRSCEFASKAQTAFDF